MVGAKPEQLKFDFSGFAAWVNFEMILLKKSPIWLFFGFTAIKMLFLLVFFP